MMNEPAWREPWRYAWYSTWGAMVLLTLLLIFDLMDQKCATPIGVAALEANHALGCYEFWLNRYQNILIGLGTVSAAGAAAYPAYRQFKTMQATLDSALDAYKFEAISKWRLLYKEIHCFVGMHITEYASIDSSVEWSKMEDRFNEIVKICMQAGHRMNIDDIKLMTLFNNVRFERIAAQSDPALRMNTIKADAFKAIFEKLWLINAMIEGYTNG